MLTILSKFCASQIFKKIEIKKVMGWLLIVADNAVVAPLTIVPEVGDGKGPTGGGFPHFGEL